MDHAALSRYSRPGILCVAAGLNITRHGGGANAGSAMDLKTMTGESRGPREFVRRGLSWRLVPLLIAILPGWSRSASLRPATPRDLESRYACGGGGTYAPETGIQWYREWDGCYVKYPSRVGMPHKMWTVGKMDYRPTTMRGGPDNVVLALPYPGTYTPNAAVITDIFNAETPFIEQTIRYSADHLGNTWSVANEPNWAPLFTPADYALQFHLYSTFIRGLDPTAKVVTGGLLVSNHYTGPTYAGIPWWSWIDQFRAAYQSAYGTPPPVDIWDIHPYDAGDDSGGTSPGQKSINNIVAMRQYLDNAGLPDAPISISEICAFTTDDSTQVEFINTVFAWLNANADRFKVVRWFWWISTTRVYASGLFDGSYSRASINAKGDAYMHRMGRVFVDPGWTPDPTRIKGSMRNPYASLAEVCAASDAGSGDLPAHAIVYDFSTGRNYVLVPMPDADFDNDGDVDLGDFVGFQFCMNGPNRPLRDPGCHVADFDGDGDTDLDDFATFQACFNGPNRSPACGT